MLKKNNRKCDFMNIDECFIYNKDALDLFKKIDNESVDLIVTDPPYKCISGGKPKNKNRPSGILKENNGKIFTHNNIKPEEFIPELYRVLKNNSQCYIMVNLLNLNKYINICLECGFKLHNLLIWEKNNVTPSRWYMKNAEYILFLRKGKAKPINNISSKTIHRYNNILKNKKHPTEKPIKLMELYIKNSSNEGDYIFDPFMGSGSTMIAALKNNRNFIGCEIDEKYYNISKERLKKYIEEN